MNYEYLASPPYAVMTFTAFVMMIILTAIVAFATLATIHSASKGKALQALVYFVVTLLTLSLAIKTTDWKEPSPDYEKVTAKLTDSGFTRDEKSGKSSYVTAGYLAYAIEDGSNLIYYQRIGNGSVAASLIYLYKVKKESK